jgi:hypothetical protein
MARQVYFSFHFDDVQRANIVRNSQTIRAADNEVGYYDHSLWEEAKTKGVSAIESLIDDGLSGASVTVVLIGTETYRRSWVLYEIAKSHNQGMGLLGIHINGIGDWNGLAGAPGPNPFAEVSVPAPLGGRTPLSSFYPVYDWVGDDGYTNAPEWIEQAATHAGR